MEKENTNITKDEAQQVSSFAKYRGKLKELYSTDREVRNRLGVSSPLAGLSKVKTKDAQDLYSEAVADPSKAADISLAAYYMSNAYESIINYIKFIFVLIIKFLNCYALIIIYIQYISIKTIFCSC